jgi:hypothetical protein
MVESSAPLTCDEGSEELAEFRPRIRVRIRVRVRDRQIVQAPHSPRGFALALVSPCVLDGVSAINMAALPIPDRR